MFLHERGSHRDEDRELNAVLKKNMSSFTDAEYVAARRKLIELGEKKSARKPLQEKGGGTQRQLDDALKRVVATVKTIGMRRASERELLEQLALVDALRRRDYDAHIESQRVAVEEARKAGVEAGRQADARVAHADASAARALRNATVALEAAVAKVVCETAIVLAKEREQREALFGKEREASSAALAEAREAMQRCEQRCLTDVEAIKAHCVTQRDSEIAKARSAAAKAAAAADAAFAETRAARSERDAVVRARAADATAHAAEKKAWKAKADADMEDLDVKIRRLLAARDDHIHQLQADLKRANHDRSHCRALLADLDSHVVAIAGSSAKTAPTD